jgi:hypothetical protein
VTDSDSEPAVAPGNLNRPGGPGLGWRRVRPVPLEGKRFPKFQVQAAHAAVNASRPAGRPGPTGRRTLIVNTVDAGTGAGAGSLDRGSCQGPASSRRSFRARAIHMGRDIRDSGVILGQGSRDLSECTMACVILRCRSRVRVDVRLDVHLRGLGAVCLA